MSRPDTDLVVVGGGPGGYVAAIRAAQAGMDVVLVEESQLGGVCLNVGCVPSKALIHAAEMAAGHGAPPGVPVPSGTVDVNQIATWQSEIVERLRRGVTHLVSAAGATVLDGTARLEGPGRITVTGTDSADLSTGKVILATGSSPRGLPNLPVDGERVVTSTEALTPPSANGRLVVVGGGYIGVELAGAYADLGWSVAVIELADRLLPTMDAELAELATRDLRARGVDVLTQHRVESDDGSCVTVVGSEGSRALPAELVVVAVGRAPRSDGIGLETVTVTPDPEGFVVVDDRCQTSAPDILAIGDLTPGPALAHAAMQQGTVAAEVAAGLPARYDPAAVPAVVYTRPELATVGLTPAQAADRGIDVRVHEVPLTANARALTLGAAGGRARLVTDAERGLVLGGHLAGPQAGELVGTVALAIEMGATIEDLGGTVLPHPSLSEQLSEAAHLAGANPRHLPDTRGPRVARP